MASEGPNSPSANAEDTSVGNQSWVNPGNVYASDGQQASASSLSNTPNGTYYIKATGFGFTIPTGATIDGVTAAIEKASSRNNRVFDLSVKLVVGGVIGGTEKASASSWATSDTTVQYGGVADLWGLTPSDTDVNGTDFGIAVAAYSSDQEDASIDHITLTVEYTESVGGDVLGSAALSGTGTISAIGTIYRPTRSRQTINVFKNSIFRGL